MLFRGNFQSQTFMLIFTQCSAKNKNLVGGHFIQGHAIIIVLNPISQFDTNHIQHNHHCEQGKEIEWETQD